MTLHQLKEEEHYPSPLQEENQGSEKCRDVPKAFVFQEKLGLLVPRLKENTASNSSKYFMSVVHFSSETLANWACLVLKKRIEWVGDQCRDSKCSVGLWAKTCASATLKGREPRLSLLAQIPRTSLGLLLRGTADATVSQVKGLQPALTQLDPLRLHL